MKRKKKGMCKSPSKNSSTLGEKVVERVKRNLYMYIGE